MTDFVAVLRCPATHEPLDWHGDGSLVSRSGVRYPYQNGVACLLPNLDLTEGGKHASIREFYQNEGWTQDAEGQFSDTKAFVDTRSAPLSYTRRCIKRLGRHFKNGGEYLLDAGSGPITHPELLSYGDAFEKRVCVDLSAQALRSARQKLGDRGVYLQGDLTRLPLANNSMDAITCNHVIYQLPEELQVRAMLELWRVLKPGGVAVVVYLWDYSGIASRVDKFAGALGWDRGETGDETPELFHQPQGRTWFEAQDWPFQYGYECFRVIDNPLMRRRIPDNWLGAAFLTGLYLMQAAVPAFCGKHGAFPAFIIRKP